MEQYSKDKIILEILDKEHEKGTISLSKTKILQTIKNKFPSLLSNIELLHSSENLIYYYYLSEGIYDLGWGCAWRCIQTLLSSLILNDYEYLKTKDKNLSKISFENLFYSIAFIFHF